MNWMKKMNLIRMQQQCKGFLNSF